MRAALVLLILLVGAGAADARETTKAEQKANLAGREVSRAVRSGDAELVAKALRVRHVNLDWSEFRDPTPLYAAAQLGRPDLVRMLLAAKADKDHASSPLGATPLYAAVYFHHPEIVDILLAAGANPDLVSPARRSPLHAAMEQDQPEIFDKLLKAGADVNNKLSVPLPLADAAGRGQIAYVQRLIAAGAAVSDSNMVMKAVQRADANVLRALLDAGAPADATTPQGESALNAAIETSQVEAARMLLKAGAKLDPQAALLRLARSQSAELLPQLLAAGADVNARTQSGGSALLWSATRANVEIMRRTGTVKLPVAGRVESQAYLSGTCRIVDGREVCRMKLAPNGEILIRDGARALVVTAQADVAEFIEVMNSQGFTYDRVGFDGIRAGGTLFYIVDGVVAEMGS